MDCFIFVTGKYLSESLASTNPQNDERLFIELRVQYMKIASLEHVVYTNFAFVFVQNNLCTPRVLSMFWGVFSY